MKQQLMATLTKLTSLRDKAQETADNSERGTTQDRYTAIADYLGEAIAMIENAIEEVDQ